MHSHGLSFLIIYIINGSPRKKGLISQMLGIMREEAEKRGLPSEPTEGCPCRKQGTTCPLLWHWEICLGELSWRHLGDWSHRDHQPATEGWTAWTTRIQCYKHQEYASVLRTMERTYKSPAVGGRITRYWKSRDYRLHAVACSKSPANGGRFGFVRLPLESNILSVKETNLHQLL